MIRVQCQIADLWQRMAEKWVATDCAYDLLKQSKVAVAKSPREKRIKTQHYKQKLPTRKEKGKRRRAIKSLAKVQNLCV